MGYPFEQGPQIYMTPKAAEHAIGVGLVAVLPNIEDLTKIGDFVNANMAAPEYRLPAPIPELTIVMRWSGEGARWRWQWDTQFENAPGDTRYLHAWAITQPRLDALQMYGPQEHDIVKAQVDPYKTIEVSIRDWEDPAFNRKFAEGIMFRGAGRSKKSFMGKLSRDVFEAFDPESNRRFRIGREAGAVVAGDSVEEQFDRTFKTIQPVIRRWGQEPRALPGGGFGPLLPVMA